MLTKNTPLIDDPLSPIERHAKWKLARTKRYGHMTSQAAQEISDKIVSSWLRFNFNNFFYNNNSLISCFFLSCFI